MTSRCRTLLLGPALLFALFLNATAAEPEPVREAPKLLIKSVPESLDDLRDLEKAVQAVVAKVSGSTVGLIVGGAQGSGVVIKDGFILTAGHVSGVPNASITVVLPDGTKLKGKALGRNTGIDSGLVKFTQEDKRPPAIELGSSKALKPGQWVVAIGHPGGHRVNRPFVVRVGRVLSVTNTTIRTDCALVGGDSGGPLFDLDGRVVGIHSRIGGFRIDENMHVPVDTFVATWDRLARGESWGGQLGTQAIVATPGGKVIFEKADKLAATDPLDVGREKPGFSKTFDLRMSPAAVYTLDMTGGDRKKPFDPFLRIEGSDRKKLAEDDDGGGTQNARIVFRPRREDTFRIFATTCDPDQTGDFKLSVRQFDPKDVYVTGKTSALAAFIVPRELAPLLFAKLTKSKSTLGLRGTLLDASGDGVAGKEVPFTWAGGSSKNPTDELGQVRLPLTQEMTRGLTVAVPAGLRLLVELADGDGNPLYKTFAESTPSSGGPVVQEVKDALVESDPADKTRTGCKRRVHTFKMAPRATYTVDLESAKFDAYLRIEDTNGKSLAGDDDSGANLNARIVYSTGAKEETVQLVVTTSAAGQTGAYELRVHQKP